MIFKNFNKHFPLFDKNGKKYPDFYAKVGIFIVFVIT